MERKPKDLGYGDTLQIMSQLEEVSKLLEAYAASILNSDFPPITDNYTITNFSNGASRMAKSFLAIVRLIERRPANFLDEGKLKGLLF